MKNLPSKPVIGFDFLTIPDTALGTTAYLMETLRALRRALPEAQFVVLASKKFSIEHREEFEKLEPVKTLFVELPKSFLFRAYAQQFWTPLFWIFRGADIVHSVGFTAPVGVAAKKILNLHRRSLRLPNLALAPILHTASHVFVESHKIQEEIVARFPRVAAKVSVVSPGVSAEVPSNQPLPADIESVLPAKYFLHVGSLEEKARIHNVIQAFAKVAHRPRFKNVGLVFIASASDKVEPWFEVAAQFSLKDRVFFVPHLPRKEFLVLLARCESLIYSGATLELPPVVYQAVAFKKPVLVSMDPEDIKFFDISGGLIAFVSNNSKNLAEKLTLALSDLNLKNWLELNNAEIKKQHSWDQLARSVVNIYQKFLPHCRAQSAVSGTAATVITNEQPANPV